MKPMQPWTHWQLQIRIHTPWQNINFYVFIKANGIREYRTEEERTTFVEAKQGVQLEETYSMESN